MTDLKQIGVEGGHYDKASEPPASGNDLLKQFLKAAADAGITHFDLPAQPDCRTCANSFDSYEKANCMSLEVCTNGDKYQPAPKVVLWRTE